MSSGWKQGARPEGQRLPEDRRQHGPTHNAPISGGLANIDSPQAKALHASLLADAQKHGNVVHSGLGAQGGDLVSGFHFEQGARKQALAFAKKHGGAFSEGEANHPSKRGEIVATNHVAVRTVPMQTGTKGGSFYLTATGAKVYKKT